MDPALREILTAVREGRLAPAAAAGRLQALRSSPNVQPSQPRGGVGGHPSSAVWAEVTDEVDHQPTRPRAHATGTATDQTATDQTAIEQTAIEPTAIEPGKVSTGDRGTTALRIRAITRKINIIGDPRVATVSIDGPHELRREGTTLVCDSERDLPFGDPFGFLPTAMGRFRLQGPSRGMPWGTALEIRVNPELDVDVELTAGSLHVQDVGRLRARVTAGSARVEDVSGPLDLHVVGGTAKIDTVLEGGANRIRGDSGSVVLRLKPGSNVRFRPEAQLGRIVIDGVDGGREVTVGAGTGRLRVEVVMGSIQVEVAT